jgi:hypothetical protein
VTFYIAVISVLFLIKFRFLLANLEYMKRYLFFGFYAISFTLSTSTEGQSISNVQSFQEDGKAVIVYDLLSTDPSKEFYVKLFCSTDGGSAYRPILTQVTGDVNNIVKTGNGKMAIWDVQKEANSTKDEFIFRLDALSVGPNGVLPSYMERGVVVQIMDVMRSGKDVSLLVVVTNRNSSLNQFVFANFLVVDYRAK